MCTNIKFTVELSFNAILRCNLQIQIHFDKLQMYCKFVQISIDWLR